MAHSFKEKSFLKKDQKKYETNYDKIFKEKETSGRDIVIFLLICAFMVFVALISGLVPLGY